MIPYASDQQTKIDRDTSGNQNVSKIVAAKGVLTITSVQEQKNHYTIKAPNKDGRLIVIEEPKMDGWKLVEPDAKTVTETSTHYRIRKQVDAGKTVAFDTVLQYVNNEEITVANLDRNTLLSYLSIGGSISADAKKALQEAAEKRRAVDEYDQKIRTLDAQRRALFDEQERLRKNLKAVPENSDLAKRYLKTLDEQENKLQDYEQQIETLRKKRAEAWSQFADYGSTMTF